MKTMMRLSAALAILFTCTAFAQDIRKLDPRYCGSPARDILGEIKRNTTSITIFRLIHPCPTTGQSEGTCPKWEIDYVIPLACGGCDDIVNMQWLPSEVKSNTSPTSKDRWERKIYAAPIPFPDTLNCVNEILKE